MRKSIVALALIFALNLAAQPLPLATSGTSGFSPAGLQRLHDSMESFVDDGKHAGIVTLIARDGRIVDWQAFGTRDVAKKLPMEKDTIVRIYSMSKLITSVAALQLIEEGRLGIDDPLAKHLPQFKDTKVLVGGSASAPEFVEAKTPVTIRHLLTHTSGYTYDIMSEGVLQQLYTRQNLWQAESMDDFLKRASRVPLRHQPGEEFTYGINTDILGGVIEKVAGKPFETVLEERIFRPLGMTDTGFRVPREKQSRLAVLYSADADGKLQPIDPILGAYSEGGKGFPSGGGGLFSTAGDYLRFAQMLLDQGRHNGKRILSRKMVEAMLVNHLAHLSTPYHQFREAYGFGLGVEVRISMSKGELPGSLGQFGWYGIATTHCDIDPSERTIALVLTQHLPFDQHGLFSRFNSLFYGAME